MSRSLFHGSKSSIACYSTKVCIVGGGLAGLSVAYQLINENKANSRTMELTCYDNHRIGEGGASAVVGGLLHPLTPKGTLIWNGKEGLKETEEVIRKLESTSRKKIQHATQKIIRPILNETQYKKYQKSSTLIPEVRTLLSILCFLSLF